MSVTLRATGAAANAPRANWANANAGPVIGLLDPAAPPYGDLPASEIPAALRRIVRALNVPADRAHMVRPAEVGPRWFSAGSSDERARERLAEAARILRFAASIGSGVSWD